MHGIEHSVPNADDSTPFTDPLGPHLLPQLTRMGTWIAVALFAAGSLLADRVRTPTD